MRVIEPGVTKRKGTLAKPTRSPEGLLMRRATRVLGLLLLILALALPAAADKAKSLYEKGRDAEARQNYEQAYEYFKQAYDLKPKNIAYRTSSERTKFLAAASRVHRGQILRDGGKLQEALAEFEKAYEIDPSSFIARQEIKRTQEQIKEAQQPAPPPAPHPLRQRIEQAQGPVELKPISDIPLNLHITEDTKIIYQTIGKLAGINVIFDPDYSSKRITVDLNNETLYHALEIVSLESKTFWRPVTSNTIFVAQDTKPKRTELEQNVVKTFYLQNATQATDVQDVSNTLRSILEITKVQAVNTQGAVIVRGTPDQIALAEKIVSDLDKPKPEVLIEVAVMEVSRNKIRELGISPPTSAQIQLQPNVTTSTTSSTTGTTTPTTTSTTPQVTLNKLANLSAKDFLVTIPSASASFLFSDSNTRMIQNPQIRALDGQKATLKIGDRVPVATGSFQPGIGGIGINPLVNTQFQYQDVGVNIDVTPQVHADREVTLKISLEVSAVGTPQTIGGIQEPTFTQRKVDHTIRLKEGEINLMGGILEQQDIKNIQGFPWLSQIPFFKYFFSQEHVQRADTEIVFAIIPHIVRGLELTDLNTRAIDVGTANAIELRYSSAKAAAPPAPGAPSPAPPARMQAPAPAAAAPPAPAPATPPPPQTEPQPIPAPPAETARPAGGQAVLTFDPPQVSQAVGSTFAINVVVNGAANLYSLSTQLNFDPKTLQLVNVSNGGFLSRDGQAVALVQRDAGAGNIPMTATRPPGSGGVSGQGAVFTLTFLAKAPGQSVISIAQAAARDANMQAVAVNAAQATVTVK
jgi:general secretion pathway protein D